MSNEEFERKMAFLVEQQAQFVADIQQLQATQSQTENVVGRLANATLAGFNDVNVKIEGVGRFTIRTDETRRNLIAVADRYFNEGRNGR